MAKRRRPKRGRFRALFRRFRYLLLILCVLGLLFIFYLVIIQAIQSRAISEVVVEPQHEVPSVDILEDPAQFLERERNFDFEEFEFYFYLLFLAIPVTFASVGLILIYQALVRGASSSSERPISESMQRKMSEHRTRAREQFVRQRLWILRR